MSDCLWRGLKVDQARPGVAARWQPPVHCARIARQPAFLRTFRRRRKTCRRSAIQPHA